MGHLLIYLFREFVVRIDHWLQRPLQKVVPEFDELLADPEKVLVAHEIVIGPLRRVVASTFLALIIGLFTCCAVSGIGLDDPQLIKGIPPAVRVLIVFGITALVTAGLALVFDRVWRGGELVLRNKGVVLRRRDKTVFVPWSAFSGVEESRITDDSWWIFRVPSQACDLIMQSRHGILVKRGGDVRTRQFFFRKNGQAVLANYYAVKLTEIVRLLRTVGDALGPKCPSNRAVECGEFLTDEFH